MNGQKIWQTWGNHHSDWMFTLVRTDPGCKAQTAGISFLLIKLDSPGVRRPGADRQHRHLSVSSTMWSFPPKT